MQQAGWPTGRPRHTARLDMPSTLCRWAGVVWCSPGGQVGFLGGKGHGRHRASLLLPSLLLLNSDVPCCPALLCLACSPRSCSACTHGPTCCPSSWTRRAAST